MDAVQIGHLRVFANAVASMLQAAADQGAARGVHLKDLLQAVDRSVQAGGFIAAAPAAPAAQSVAVVGLAAPGTVAGLAALAKPLQPDLENGSGQQMRARTGPSGAAAQGVGALPLKPASPAPSASASLQLGVLLAGRFFMQLPWSGGKPLQVLAPQPASAPAPVPVPVPGLQAQAQAQAHGQRNAMNFFAALPWTAVRPGNLHIGAGADNGVQVTLLKARLGQTGLPDFFSHGMGLDVSLSATTPKPSATGFFAKIPWARGRLQDQSEAVHKL